MAVKFSNIDLIIGREVGQLIWKLLPELFPGLLRDDHFQAIEKIWHVPEPTELIAVRKEDPLVEYPALFTRFDVAMGTAPAPFIYSPVTGHRLRLSEYLRALRMYLHLQLTGGGISHKEILSYAVNSLSDKLTTDELLKFVDDLWRGRWFIGAKDWSSLRRYVITIGNDEKLKKVKKDLAYLESHALRLFKSERKFKKQSESLDEWFFESYCVLPDVFTWLLLIREANEENPISDLPKYDRILDEFQADISTTISIPVSALIGQPSLAETYAIKPLREADTVEQALAQIRGIYKGRTIVPRVWYEDVVEVIGGFDKNIFFSDKELSLRYSEYSQLNEVDHGFIFGLVATLDSIEFPFGLIGLIDIGDSKDSNEDQINLMNIMIGWED